MNNVTVFCIIWLAVFTFNSYQAIVNGSELCGWVNVIYFIIFFVLIITACKR